MAMLPYLSHALVTQAVHDLHSGQLRRCKELGFDEATLQGLKDPLFVGLLANARAEWYSLKINSTVTLRLLTHAQTIAQETAAIDRALKLDSSEQMIRQFYGVIRPDVTLRRHLLCGSRRLGRRPALTERQEAELWRHWHTEVKLRDINLQDEKALFDLCLDLAEQFGPPASTLWTAMQEWVEEEQRQNCRHRNASKE